MSDLKSAIDRIEKALRSRYNVLALDGELAVAVTEAREGRLDALTATLEGRALYQHAAPIAEAMADAEAALVGGPEPEAARRKRVLSDLRLDELLDLAKANDIAVEQPIKKADVFKLLKDAKVEVPQPDEEDNEES